MGMKQCRRCFEIKDVSEYSPGQARCRACRNEARREKRLIKRMGVEPLPAHVIPVLNFLKVLLRSYSAPTPLDVPVRALHNVVQARNACIVRRIDGRDWYCIASRRGSRQLALDGTGPIDLIQNLRALGLEVLLPTNREVMPCQP